MTSEQVHELADAIADLDPAAEWDDASIADIARDMGIDLDATDIPAVRAAMARTED